ncbi:hypothetical protein SCHPADRAFT_946764 [Schizopora paradoxa]|uniref:Uncharacterized protein n=1 Tax=Schizopora paradoxa TaxID=27342 RepID=A0A0H2RLA3_9AGAM|nr:hypothetical protein SCHPADRAFT_946764 [Schizopora paradoxa]
MSDKPPPPKDDSDPRNLTDPPHQRNPHRRNVHDVRDVRNPSSRQRDTPASQLLPNKPFPTLVVADTEIVQAYPLGVRDERIFILGQPGMGDYETETETDDSSLTLSSSSSESQSSRMPRPPLRKLAPSPSGEKSNKPGKMRASNAPSALAQLVPPEIISGAAPSDLINYLVSPECAFTSQERSDIFKAVLKFSVLGYDADSHSSKFSWALDRISKMNERARLAALLHSEHTIIALCEAMLGLLEKVTAEARPIAEDEGVTKSYVHSVVGRQNRKTEEELESLRTLVYNTFRDGSASKGPGGNPQLHASSKPSQPTQYRASSSIQDLMQTLAQVAQGDATPPVPPKHRDRDTPPSKPAARPSGPSGPVKDSQAQRLSKPPPAPKRDEKASNDAQAKGKRDEKASKDVPSKGSETPTKGSETPTTGSETVSRGNKKTIKKKADAAFIALLREQLEAKDQEVLGKKATIANLLSMAAKRVEELKGHERETTELKEEVKSLKATLIGIWKLVEEALEMHDMTEEEHKMSLQLQQAEIGSLMEKLEASEAHARAEESLVIEVAALKSQMTEVRKELEDAKAEAELLRKALAGDKKALDTIRFRAYLDRMKRDMCIIAGIYNSDPWTYSSPIESHADLNGYTYFEATLSPDTQSSSRPTTISPHSISFSPAALTFASTAISKHTLKGDVDEVIDNVCRDGEKKMAKLCFVALETFRPMELRLKEQEVDDALDEKYFQEDFAYYQPKNWKSLREWLHGLKEEFKKSESVKK